MRPGVFSLNFQQRYGVHSKQNTIPRWNTDRGELESEGYKNFPFFWAENYTTKEFIALLLFSLINDIMAKGISLQHLVDN